MAETIEQHLRIRWGDEATWLVTVTDQAGTPINITGATSRFTGKLRATDVDAAAIFSKTTGAGITLTDPTNGVASVTLSDTDTTTKLAPGRTHLLQFDWRVTISGTTMTVAYGDLLVEPAMSRVV